MVDPNELLYQELEALTVIGFMAMILMVVASQGPIALVRTDPHWWGPFKVGEVPDEVQKLIIGDVESSELGGGLFSSRIAHRGVSSSCLGRLYAWMGPWRPTYYFGWLS